MALARTLRDRLRAELTTEIKAAANRQLAEHGAAALSLRAVARELGLASSAVYRYFKSRDELLTALIVDAYDSLGQAAEAAEGPIDRADLFGRWSAVCAAVRYWAVQHPHEYALIYGSPVPGYRAPEQTIGPAIRVTTLLSQLVQDGVRAGTLHPLELPPPRPGANAAVSPLGQSLLAGVTQPLMLRGLLAWVEVFGVISFELFGHLHNVVFDYDAFFDYVVVSMAALVGLPLPEPAGE